MKKTLLNQILLFKDGSPIHSSIKSLYSEALKYQELYECCFIESKRRSRAVILDYDKFFEFVSEVILEGNNVKSFDEIEEIMNAKSRYENIKLSGDSKNSIVKIFGSVVIYQESNQNPVLYKKPEEIKNKNQILAVENGETFLNIYNIMHKFGFENYIYLGGFSNSATREFLKDKDVVFFLDYDIEAIRIYDSFECKSKSFFRHPNLKKSFQTPKLLNEKLYRKQLINMPENHVELQWLLDLISNHNGVIEQEVFNDTL